MVFAVDVYLDDQYQIITKTDSVRMILFHGRVDCDFFKGEILPGAVDTQKGKKNAFDILSARYIMKGKSRSDKETMIFIENNGVINNNGCVKTKPVIITDNADELGWLSKMNLYGLIKGISEDHIQICFYEETKCK